MARTPTLAPVFYLDLIGFDFTLTLSWIDRYLSVDQREAPVARLISDSAPRLFTCREGRPAQGRVFGLEVHRRLEIFYSRYTLMTNQFGSAHCAATARVGRL